MDADKWVRQKKCAESLTKDGQENSTLTEHFHATVSLVEPRSWCTPSEALSCFIPNETLKGRDIQARAPLRFGARVGNIGLLIPEGVISELVEDSKIYQLPTAPHWFQGLTNLRGNLVPVFNLKRLLEMDIAAKEISKLLVLNIAGETVGFLIDGLPVSVKTDQRLEQAPLLPSILQEHVRSVFVQDEGFWVELDFDGFFRTASSPQSG